MLSSDGTLSGTPTTNQTKTFTVQAADSESPAATARVGYTVTFGIVFTTGSLPTASIGSPYSAGPLQVKGGTAPYQFSVVGGATPPGITLDPSGTLSGTPESLGSYQFTVQVSDSGSPQQSNTKSYTVRVTPVGQWTLCGQSNLPNGGGTGIDGVTLSPGGTMSDSDGTSGSWSTRGNHITMAFGIRNYQGTWNSSLNQYQGTYNGADSGTFAMAPGGLSNGQDCVQP
jgi:hypothetical protein